MLGEEIVIFLFSITTDFFLITKTTKVFFLSISFYSFFASAVVTKCYYENSIPEMTNLVHAHFFCTNFNIIHPLKIASLTKNNKG